LNKHYIILIILFISSFLIASIGTKECYNEDGEDFYEKYILRGPDSYYNLKMCTQQLAGNYEIQDYDLKYPYGHRARPMLFTAFATSSSMIVHGLSGMSISDSLGWTILLIPCLFGALTIFPVYGIGKEFFNKRIGLLSAVFFTITPFVYNASHGSLAGLFDHDSFIMFFTIALFYTFIKLLKSESNKGMIFYGILSAVSLSAIYMAWVVHHYIFISLGLFIFLYLIYCALTKKDAIPTLTKTTFMFAITFAITFLYAINYHIITNIAFYSLIASFVLLLIYLLLKLSKRSQTVQLGFLGSISTALTIIVYLLNETDSVILSPLTVLSRFVFGHGIYSTKIMSTIQEAQLTNLSDLMIGYGFVMFIFAFLGFSLYLHKIYRDKVKGSDLFLITMFIITLYFSTEAGRFAKDLAPFIAIFGAVFLYAFVKDLDIKKLKELRAKSLMACTVVFLVFASSCFITYESVTEDHLFNEEKWVEITGDMRSFVDGPVLAWWDYGFYINSMTYLPVVADNFQGGVFFTCNVFTAQSEKEAINLMTLYLLKAEHTIYREIAKPSQDIIKKHFRIYTCKPCGKYHVKQAINLLETIKNATTEKELYKTGLPFFSSKSLQECHTIFNEIELSTGFSIDYIVVGDREIDDIKVILPYLAEKSEVGFTEVEDDWFKVTPNGIENRELFNNSFVMQLYEERELMFFEKIYENMKVKIWRIE